MREKAKRDGVTGTPSSSSREEWEKLFKDYFGLAWDTSAREQVLAALRKRTEATLALREIERVAVGAVALTRILNGLPPAEEDPPPLFPPDRKRDERYLLVWAFEESFVRFAQGPVSPRALAVVSLLMGYEHDSHRDGVLDRAAARMKTTRRRYRQERPSTPETMQQRIAQVRRFRVLEAPVRQALDAAWQMVQGIIHESKSVPVGTVSQS